MTLVVFTGFIGLYLAPGEIHPFIAFIAVMCIALGSGAAGAINMWYERDIDKLMERTSKRPIVTGRVSPEHAIEFAIIMAVASVLIMSVAVNILSAFLLLSAICFYVFVYTIWLKPSTPQNIVIGGAAGAFPPLIGWASVTNDVTIEPLILFAIIFMWTPPHFWALALKRHQEYTRAGIPMLPGVVGDLATKKQIILYTVLLLPLTLAPYFVGMSGLVYAVGAAISGLVFLKLTINLYYDAENKIAMRVFGYSIFYLALLFALLAFDHALK